jgi:hypothetical protein
LNADPLQPACSGYRACTAGSAAKLGCYSGCTESSQKFAPIHLFSP